MDILLGWINTLARFGRGSPDEDRLPDDPFLV
jgi:hypothetical protein